MLLIKWSLSQRVKPAACLIRFSGDRKGEIVCFIRFFALDVAHLTSESGGWSKPKLMDAVRCRFVEYLVFNMALWQMQWTNQYTFQINISDQYTFDTRIFDALGASRMLWWWCASYYFVNYMSQRRAERHKILQSFHQLKNASASAKNRVICNMWLFKWWLFTDSNHPPVQ